MSEQERINELKIAHVERDIEGARYAMSLDADLTSLFKNRAFKRLILERYLEQEPQRLTMLVGDPAHASDAAQAELQNQIKGLSYFNRFLTSIQQQASLAAQNLSEDELTLMELRAAALDDAENEGAE